MGLLDFFKRNDQSAMPDPGSPEFEQMVQGGPADIVFGHGEVVVPFEGGAQLIQGLGRVGGQAQGIAGGGGSVDIKACDRGRGGRRRDALTS